MTVDGGMFNYRECEAWNGHEGSGFYLDHTIEPALDKIICPFKIRAMSYDVNLVTKDGNMDRDFNTDFGPQVDYKPFLHRNITLNDLNQWQATL